MSLQSLRIRLRPTLHDVTLFSTRSVLRKKKKKKKNLLIYNTLHHLNYKLKFFFSCSSLQVYPRATTLTFTTCNLAITTITITPTIPARQNNNLVWPMISFWLPKEIQLVDNERQCEIQLRGTEPISLKIKATCPAAGATEGLKAIVPHISNFHSNFWHLRKVGLPTVWVRKQ